jgi:hypothetical protein
MGAMSGIAWQRRSRSAPLRTQSRSLFSQYRYAVNEELEYFDAAEAVNTFIAWPCSKWG